MEYDMKPQNFFPQLIIGSVAISWQYCNGLFLQQANLPATPQHMQSMTSVIQLGLIS